MLVDITICVSIFRVVSPVSLSPFISSVCFVNKLSFGFFQLFFPHSSQSDEMCRKLLIVFLSWCFTMNQHFMPSDFKTTSPKHIHLDPVYHVGLCDGCDVTLYVYV